MYTEVDNVCGLLSESEAHTAVPTTTATCLPQVRMDLLFRRASWA